MLSEIEITGVKETIDANRGPQKRKGEEVECMNLTVRLINPSWIKDPVESDDQGVENDLKVTTQAVVLPPLTSTPPSTVKDQDEI